MSVQSLNGENDISARVFVDGARISSNLIERNNSKECIIEGAIVGASTVRPMHFAVIKTSGVYMTFD